MADYANIKLERDGAVARLVLNRPERRNALTHAMMLELEDAFARVRDDQSCRVLVLRGAGGHFCAGGDLDAMADMPPDPPTAPPIRWCRPIASSATRCWRSTICRRPPSPSSKGSAVGGGFGMACCSDVVILHDSARFGVPEPKVGFIPSQIIPFVVRRIGEGAARDLAVTGRVIDAAEAHRLGIGRHLCATTADIKPDLAGGNRRCPEAGAAGAGDRQTSGAGLRDGG